MKKQLLIISAFLALFGCSKEIEVLPSDEQTPIEEQVQEIKVNLTINRLDDFAGTKATVKTAWSDGDVIFVFFKGIAAPKYLEMKYDGTTWTPTAKNSLLASDLSNATDKRMTAVFLPYGSSATVSSNGGNFAFSDITYCGYFLQSEQVSYTYDSELVGSLDLSAPSPNNTGDKYIHFDITGYNDGHSYSLSQDYVKPITFTSVSADGVVSHGEGDMGDFITGYLDSENSIISFSGLLDASVVGTSVDYQFSVDDVIASILYTRDAGDKTLNESKPIGIGNITNTSKWIATEYVDLGLSVRWAKCNLGSSSVEEYGDYFAWGETQPKEDYSWSTYKWCNGSYTSLTKYNTDSSYGAVDNKTVLALEDDAAHVYLCGLWRMPTKEELDELRATCNWEWTTHAGVNCSNVIGPNGNSIILPGTGFKSNSNLLFNGSYGYYLSSSLGTDYPYNACRLQYNAESDEVVLRNAYRYVGCPVRPVF